MKDLGFNSGMVQQIDTSKAEYKGYFGIRKMFWKYLKKLHVVFYDPCCAEASGDDKQPIAYDASQGQIVTYDGSAWVPVTSFATTTSTTTTAAPTTTTTTTP